MKKTIKKKHKVSTQGNHVFFCCDGMTGMTQHSQSGQNPPTTAYLLTDVPYGSDLVETPRFVGRAGRYISPFQGGELCLLTFSAPRNL